MNEKNEKMKPCPLCGGRKFTFGAPFFKTSDRRMYIIDCETCGTQFIPDAGSWDEAIEKINRRANDGCDD